MRAIGYARRSKGEHDDRRNLSIPIQRDTITAACERREWDLIDVLADNGHSGRAGKKRPALDEAMRRLDDGEADVLVVARFDRFRSIVDFGKVLERADRGGWQLRLLEPDVDTTTAVGRGIVNVLVCFAQMQAELDSEKQKANVAARRARGDRVGRPRQIPADVRKRIVREFKAHGSLSAVARGLNEDGVPTAQGGSTWRANTVRAVLLQEGVIKREAA
jgi:DNA invertase Pin-like site-specific DNA recombinase